MDTALKEKSVEELKTMARIILPQLKLYQLNLKQSIQEIHSLMGEKNQLEMEISLAGKRSQLLNLCGLIDSKLISCEFDKELVSTLQVSRVW